MTQCQVGCKTTTQSINEPQQSLHSGMKWIPFHLTPNCWTKLWF